VKSTVLDDADLMCTEWLGTTRRLTKRWHVFLLSFWRTELLWSTSWPQVDTAVPHLTTRNRGCKSKFAVEW